MREYTGPLVSVPSVGRSATHALVQAQLICSGARRGMHAFIVPIRSLEDHSPLPGKPMPRPLPGGDPTTTPPCSETPKIQGKSWDMSPQAGVRWGGVSLEDLLLSS